MSKVKPSYDTNRQMLGEILPIKTPFTVIIDVSERCNFKCNYCFRGQDNKKAWGYAVRNDLMSWEIFELAVEQISQFSESVKVISLSNHGEPLCNRKLPQMVKYIKEKGIKSKVSIHTNASLLDERYALELAESQIDKVVISLQGMNSAKYKDVCGAIVDFDALYDNLSYFYKHKQKTQINVKIVDVALGEYTKEQFVDKFSKVADNVFVEKMVPIWKDIDLNSNAKVNNKYGDIFLRQECCTLIFHTIVVGTTGDVYPCTQLLYPYPIGNIKNRTIKEMWDSSERNKLLCQQVVGASQTICKDCYIKQNSIFSENDMIDLYKDRILERLKEEAAYSE